MAQQPPVAAAKFGAGRAALAEREYRRAVDQLTEALTLDPRATSIHYPLAMAYRGLGDARQAEAHLAEQGKVDPRAVDPLMRGIDTLLESPEAYNIRGGAELRGWSLGRRRGVVSQRARAQSRPSRRSGQRLRHGALPDGRPPGRHARIRAGPQGDAGLRARAHFSLGVLLNDEHEYPAAVDHFRAALKFDPHYVEARVQLAGVLARSGHPGEAIRVPTKRSASNLSMWTPPLAARWRWCGCADIWRLATVLATG